MQFFIEEIQNSLWRLNGKIGSPSDYLFWAYKVLNSLKFGFIDQAEYDNAMNTFNINVLGQNNNEPNTGCE